VTRQRQAVAHAIAAADGFRSAQELHAALRRAGEAIGLTTVYRALQALADAGEIDALRTAGGEAVYRRCSAGHHHHLVCERCGTVEESTICRCDELEQELGETHGFVLSRVAETYYGLCAACAAVPRTTADEAGR